MQCDEWMGKDDARKKRRLEGFCWSGLGNFRDCIKQEVVSH